jgi:hypothetical protein
MIGSVAHPRMPNALERGKRVWAMSLALRAILRF